MNSFWFIVFTILICTIGIIILISSITHTQETFADKCKLDCSNYSFEFVDYEAPSYKNEECWCKDIIVNRPIRIY